MFPSSSSLLLFDSSCPDDEGGQSTGENVWRLHSVDPYASKPDTVTKYPSNTRKKTNIHLKDEDGNLTFRQIIPVNHQYLIYRSGIYHNCIEDTYLDQSLFHKNFSPSNCHNSNTIKFRCIFLISQTFEDLLRSLSVRCSYI